MPVRKFRSVADMPGAPALPPLSMEALRSACELMQLASRLFSVKKQPGVRKFHTIEEAEDYQNACLKKEIRLRRDRRDAVVSSQ